VCSELLQTRVGDVLNLLHVSREPDARVLSTNGRFLKAFTLVVQKLAETYLPQISTSLPTILKALEAFREMPLDKEVVPLFQEARTVRNQVLNSSGRMERFSS